MNKIINPKNQMLSFSDASTTSNRKNIQQPTSKQCHFGNGQLRAFPPNPFQRQETHLLFFPFFHARFFVLFGTLLSQPRLPWRKGPNLLVGG